MSSRAGRRALRCWELKQREALERTAKSRAALRLITRNTEQAEGEQLPDQVTVSRAELGGGEGTITISGLNEAQAWARRMARQSATAAVAVNEALLEYRTRELLVAAQSLAAKDEQKPTALPADWRQPCDHLTQAQTHTLLTDQRRTRKRTTTTQLCARRAALVGTVAPTAPPVAVGTTTAAHNCAHTPGVATPM
jgi:hypothetical protein